MGFFKDTENGASDTALSLVDLGADASAFYLRVDY